MVFLFQRLLKIKFSLVYLWQFLICFSLLFTCIKSVDPNKEGKKKEVKAFVCTLPLYVLCHCYHMLFFIIIAVYLLVYITFWSMFHLGSESHSSSHPVAPSLTFWLKNHDSHLDNDVKVRSKNRCHVLF